MPAAASRTAKGLEERGMDLIRGREPVRRERHPSGEEGDGEGSKPARRQANS